MPSSRLAILAVTVGSGLLGWSTVGVTAIAGNLSQASGATTIEAPRHDHAPDGGGHAHGHHGGDRDGV